MTEPSYTNGYPDDPPPWRILIVDDEPDVHDLTRMLIGRMVFSGRRVVLDCVPSGVSAAACLEAHPDTALILLDVVMETDDAGLRLVEHIRHRLGNRDVQIVLRTGQPGQAPEREVMLDYDINGYFLKTELTAQKLNSIVIAALRTHAYVRTIKRRRTREDTVRLPAGYLDEYVAEPFELQVRPQVNLADGSIDCFALTPRWRTPPTGNWRSELSADAAQRLNRRLIIAAGEQLASGKAQHIMPLRFALPLAFDPDYADILLDAMLNDVAAAGIPADCLLIELPEPQLPRYRSIDSSTLMRLRNRGPGLVVDHCGSDRTVLAQLRQLRPQRLKIDRRLIAAMMTDPDSAAITRSLIALAHTLGMAVVADGVESHEQCQFLNWEACEFAQGSYFSFD